MSGAAGSSHMMKTLCFSGHVDSVWTLTAPAIFAGGGNREHLLHCIIEMLGCSPTFKDITYWPPAVIAHIHIHSCLIRIIGMPGSQGVSISKGIVPGGLLNLLLLGIAECIGVELFRGVGKADTSVARICLPWHNRKLLCWYNGG